MGKVVKPYIFLLLLFVSADEALGQQTEKVLFVGNSYTYFWNLPQQVAAMAESRDQDLITWQSTSGGTSLAQHWRGEKSLESRSIIERGDFDVVVFQDFSTQALDEPDTLMHYGELFADLAEATGARVFLYQTWARQWDPYMQATITREYDRLGKKVGATVVPVGMAWQRARSLRPGFPLYDPDQSHPSPLGTYLAACVFYGVLTGDSPVGLPHRLLSTDYAGEKIYLNIQSREDALFCQKVAADILGLTQKPKQD
jgi:hypothetical protein